MLSAVGQVECQVDNQFNSTCKVQLATWLCLPACLPACLPEKAYRNWRKSCRSWSWNMKQRLKRKSSVNNWTKSFGFINVQCLIIPTFTFTWGTVSRLCLIKKIWSGGAGTLLPPPAFMTSREINWPQIMLLTHWGRVTQICVFTLQLCKTDDANLRF
jgi:hypothetical protein